MTVTDAAPGPWQPLLPKSLSFPVFRAGQGRFLVCILAFSISVSGEVPVGSGEQAAEPAQGTWCLPKKQFFTLTCNSGFESNDCTTWPLGREVVWAREIHSKHCSDPFVSEINAEILLSNLHLCGMEYSQVTTVHVWAPTDPEKPSLPRLIPVVQAEGFSIAYSKHNQQTRLFAFWAFREQRKRCHWIRIPLVYGSCKSCSCGGCKWAQEGAVGGGKGKKRALSQNSEALIPVISPLLLSLGNSHHRSQLHKFH